MVIATADAAAAARIVYNLAKVEGNLSSGYCVHAPSGTYQPAPRAVVTYSGQP
jgi:hypothetical protein